MLKDKEYNQAEELSRCLDSLSDGKHPVVQDEEINELIEVAAFVKQSFRQDDLPKVLINEMVEELATELKAQKQKRRNHWLYGGLVGTAAAVLIAGFVQFVLPQSPDNHMAERVDDSINTPKKVAAVDQSTDPTIVQSNAMTPQQNQSGNSNSNSNSTQPPKSVPVAEEKPTDSVSKVIAEIILKAEPESDEKPNQVAILQQETPNSMTMQRSASMPQTRNKSIQENKSFQPEHKIFTVMVMPNQEAQSIKVDNTSGMIQQIYNLGNNDEITITQRVMDEGLVKDDKQEKVQALAESAATEPLSKKAKGSINSITVKIDKYDITIEGNKTQKELQKIAESLAAKKIEQ